MKNEKIVKTVHYMGKSQDFTIDDIKNVWDPTLSWKEVIKDDPAELYLYKFPGVPTLYINYNGIKLPTDITENDFK
jgi:hypothetical protein